MQRLKDLNGIYGGTGKHCKGSKRGNDGKNNRNKEDKGELSKNSSKEKGDLGTDTSKDKDGKPKGSGKDMSKVECWNYGEKAQSRSRAFGSGWIYN